MPSRGLRLALDGHAFLDTNPGGRFKEQDPTVPIEVLSANWVPSSQVVYIGKANVADRRLRQFARFGAGERIGHWGGRYIWQLLDSINSWSRGTQSRGLSRRVTTRSDCSGTSPACTAEGSRLMSRGF